MAVSRGGALRIEQCEPVTMRIEGTITHTRSAGRRCCGCEELTLLACDATHRVRRFIGVVQRMPHDLGRVDDAGLHEVGELALLRVVAVVDVLCCRAAYQAPIDPGALGPHRLQEFSALTMQPWRLVERPSALNYCDRF